MRQGFTPDLPLLAKSEALAELCYAEQCRKFNAPSTAAQVLIELASFLEQTALALEHDLLNPAAMRAAALAMRAKAAREMPVQRIGPNTIINPPTMPGQGGA